MASLKARIAQLEAAAAVHERPFFSYCLEWDSKPDHRQQIAHALGVSEAAAAYICAVGLKHGEPQDNRFPLRSWTMPELKKALSLIDQPDLI